MAGTTKAKPKKAISKPPWSVAGVATGNGGAYAFSFGLPALETSEFIVQIEAGFPYSAWDHFVEHTGLPREVVARVIDLPLRTLSRRKEEGRLHADESDRLVRLARIYTQTLGLFEGDSTTARSWLTNPQLALNGATPLDYCGTEVGAREVETLIGRLAHGIPS